MKTHFLISMWLNVVLSARQGPPPKAHSQEGPPGLQSQGDPLDQIAKSPRQKEVCVSIPAPGTTDIADLELNCDLHFGISGVIAVKQVLYGTGNGCQQNVSDWSCLQDSTDSSTNILQANGLKYHRVAIQPLKVAWCPRPSTHVYVKYTCYDARDLRNVCDPFDTSSFDAVNLVSSDYTKPYRYVGKAIPAATCVCNASVPSNAKLRAIVIDLDLFHGSGMTCAEQVLHGSTTEYLGLWGILNGLGVCARSELPRNVTLQHPSWSLIYSTEDLYLTRPRRGFWFQIAGVSRNGLPVPVTLSCAPYGVIEPPYWGSGSVSASSTVDSSTVSRTTSTSGPQQIPSEPKPDSYIGVIAGVAVGGLLVLVLFAVAVFFCLRRRNAQAVRDDFETKIHLPPVAPNLPPRNTPTKASATSRTSSCPEYFEPMDDNIYCMPEDVKAQVAQYEILEGMSNPAHDYIEPVGEGNKHETKRPLSKEVSGEYDAVGGFPDYENGRLEGEDKNTEYCHLENQAMTQSTDYEKMTI